MKIQNISAPVTVIGVRVPAFPHGIKETFEKIYQSLGDRNYYGISYMDDKGQIVYYAMAEENYEGEGKQLNYDVLVIESGDYIAEVIEHWKNKTDTVMNVFQLLIADERTSKKHPCIEWYKSADELVCMIRKV